MRLDKLELYGFKSFADRICLEFNNGITSVVGPNGSGKSNIADAVRWVLGEQSMKALRGSKMEDIIFAGTQHRKPLGFAEVIVTLDNKDSYLPVQYSEVTVSRRVYRSGESEYFLNKTPCRLKDIYDLFLDTGIGRDGYSIIGQGRIDEILSTRSEDRRHIFEEASGIMKYKVKKIEAERKLDHTKQNLVRINDVIYELESRLGPLSEQASVARKFLDMREELKVLEVNIFMDGILKIRERLSEHEEIYKSQTDSINEMLSQKEKLSENCRKKREQQKALENRYEETRTHINEIEGKVATLQGEITLKKEKISNVTANVERLKQEIAEIENKKQTFSQDLNSRKKKIVYLEGQLKDFETKLALYENKLAESVSSLDDMGKYIEGLSTEIFSRTENISNIKLKINSVENNILNLDKRKLSIEKEFKDMQLEKDRLFIKTGELSALLKTINNRLNILRQEFNAREAEKKKAEEEHLLTRKELSETKAGYQAVYSRLKVLLEMEQGYEGYNRAVKELLIARENRREDLSGIHGVVARLIHVPAEYAMAVETVLGPVLQNIITGTDEDAKYAIDYLKKNRIGRASFLPLNTIRARLLEPSVLEKISKEKGFLAIASEIVSCDNVYKVISRNLLARTVVFDTLENALPPSRKFSHSFRIVTLEGDIINTGGVISGGSNENKTSGLLTRQNEIVNLELLAGNKKEKENVLQEKMIELAAIITEAEKYQEERRQKLQEAEIERVKIEGQLARFQEEEKTIAVRKDILTTETEQTEFSLKELKTEHTGRVCELLKEEEEIAASKGKILTYQEKHKEEMLVRDRLHNEITDYRISVNSVKESIQAIMEIMTNTQAELASADKARLDKENSIARLGKDYDKFQFEIDGIKKRLEEMEQSKCGKNLEMDRLIEEKNVLNEEILSSDEEQKDIASKTELLREDIMKLEVKKARLESELDALQNRLWDEYELTFGGALELKKEIGGINAAKLRINELKEDIKALGAVNVAAIDEYVKIKERFDFLCKQRDDLEKSSDKLARVIYEMVAVMKKQFSEQFRLINENFILVFRELFEGGNASLVINDNENILESGIEIEVQPPGKKLQNMLLLSGGERALTAIALLFAILKLKPSPFCVLDEIEAALDDANVYRFGEYLKRYCKETQFIMVTHRKGTMEASDTLYGVTMKEQGVSSIVSMKLGEKAG